MVEFFPLDIPVIHHSKISGLRDMFVNCLCHCNRAVFAAGTADGNTKLAFVLLVAIQRQHIVEKIKDALQEAFRHRRIHDEIADWRIQTGQFFQLRNIERIRQTTHIEHKVRVGRHAVFEAEGSHIDHQFFSGALHEQFLHAAAELGGGQQRSIHHEICLRFQRSQQLSLFLNRLRKGTAFLAQKRVTAAGHFITVDDFLVGCVKENHANITAGQVFVTDNVSCIGRVCICCAGVGLACLPAAFFYAPLVFMSVIMGFLGPVVNVVRQVFRAAVELREENDLTI